MITQDPQMQFGEVEDRPIGPLEFASVQVLLAEVGRYQQIYKALVTWENALKVFREAERTYGLPNSGASKTIYLTLVSRLRASGYEILHLASERAQDVKEFGIEEDVKALRAGLLMLEVDDRAQFLNEDREAVARLNAHFGQ